MDCIAMVPAVPERPWTTADATAARTRFEARRRRLEREQAQQDDRLAARALATLDEPEAAVDFTAAEMARKKAVVQAAIERARARRRQTATGGVS
jgi:electron transport complex protein RnfB